MENFIKIITKPDNVAIVVMIFMIAFFTWLAFREALRNDRGRKKPNNESGEESQADSEKIHTWPFLARKEFIIAILVFALLLVWSIILDAPLEEQANPTLTPNLSKRLGISLDFRKCWCILTPGLLG